MKHFLFQGQRWKKMGLAASILFVAFCIRIWHITVTVPEIFSDEAIGVVSARSYLATGKDIEGKRLLFFSDRVELRPPVYGYLALVSTMIFGWNEFAIRLPAVIGGVVAIAALMIITKELVDHQTAIVSGMVMAILPWHIHYSRIGWEPAAFLPLFLCSVAFVLLAVRTQKKVFFLSSGLCFSLTLFSYNSALVPVGIFMLVFGGLLLCKNGLSFRTLFLWSILPILCASMVVFLMLTQPSMTTRSKAIFTFAPGVNAKTVRQFVQNYTAHFSLDFLAISGDPNYRHGMQRGVLQPWMIPFLLVGTLATLLHPKKRTVLFLFVWLLYFPLGGALTNDGVPHATRTLIGAPLFALLIARGIVAFDKFLRRSTSLTVYHGATFVFAFIVGTSTGRFLQEYYVQYPAKAAPWWEQGNKAVFNTARQYELSSSAICLGNLTYWNVRPLMAYYGASSPVYVEKTDDARCFSDTAITVVPAHAPTIGTPFLTTFNHNQEPQFTFFFTGTGQRGR